MMVLAPVAGTAQATEPEDARAQGEHGDQEAGLGV